MGICLEFVFLQIFKSRSGPRSEFNNNFSRRSELGTDFILHKPNWDSLLFSGVTASHGNLAGARPELGRGKSPSQKVAGEEKNSEVKVLSLTSELSTHESRSVDGISESVPRNLVLL